MASARVVAARKGSGVPVTVSVGIRESDSETALFAALANKLWFRIL